MWTEHAIDHMSLPRTEQSRRGRRPKDVTSVFERVEIEVQAPRKPTRAGSAIANGCSVAGLGEEAKQVFLTDSGLVER